MSDVVVVRQPVTNVDVVESDLTQAIGDARYAALAHHIRHEAGGADGMAIDAAAATGSLRTLGTGAAQAAAGTHAHSGTYVALVAAPTGVAATDTAAIHAARDAAGAGELIFSAGNYAVSGLGAYVANQQWRLTPLTKLVRAAGSGSALAIGASGVTIEGGTVDCTAQTGGDGIPVNAAGVLTDVTLRNVTVLNAYAYGIHGYGVTRLTVDRCRVVNSGNVGIFGEVNPALTALTDFVVTGCLVDRSSLSAGTIAEGGIKAHGNNTLTMDRTRIANNTVLMPSLPTDTAAICIETYHGCPHAVIEGNSTSGGYMGISADSSDYASVVGNTVAGAKYGIEVPISQHFVVSGNTIDGQSVTINGIWIDNTSAYGTIGSNDIRKCTAIGIQIEATTGGHFAVVSNAIQHDVAGATFAINVKASYCPVTGNTIEMGGVGTVCVNIDSAVGVPVTGNVLRNYLTGAVQISGTAVDFCPITGNDASSSTGSLVVRAGGATAAGGIPVFNNPINGTIKNGFIDWNSDQRWIYATGSPSSATDPNGTQSASRGSVYFRARGGPGASLYVKEDAADATTTGWVPMMGLRTKAGAPVDGDFNSTPPDGLMVTDTTNSRLYIRIGGTWKAVQLS